MGFWNKKLIQSYYPGGFPDPNNYPDDMTVGKLIVGGMFVILAIGYFFLIKGLI